MKIDVIDAIALKLAAQQSLAVTAASEVPLEHRFYMISAAGRARWILPQLPRLGLPTLRQWRPYGMPSKIKWQALLSLYKYGLLGHAPGVESFGIKGLALYDWSRISWHSHTEPAMTIYIGSPGATSKAVISLSSQTTGHPEVILKIPLGERAAESISHESNALRSLAGHKYKISPRLLYHDAASGWSTQEAINGESMDVRLARHHHVFFTRLYAESAFSSLTELANLMSGRIDRLASLPHEEVLVLRQALTQIGNDTPIKIGWMHGDFAPWNLKWSDNTLIALDWEFAEPSAPIGLDLIHYICTVDRLTSSIHHSARQSESRVVRIMNDFKLDSLSTQASLLRRLFRYYLIWYQVALEERGIRNSTRLDYLQFSKELVNESL